jgi:uncharacterized membrane protein YphA (DoxX/SURF4 family)
MRLPNTPTTPLAWFGLMRIMLGLMFLTTWGNNLVRGRYTPDGLRLFFTQTFPQSANPLTFYAAFINDVILPVRGVFAPFQLVAEGVMGLALLIGLLTPLTCVFAVFFLGNVFLATFGHDWPWAYLMPISLLGALFFTRAGRSLGVDAFLQKRFGEPKLPFW